MFKSLQFARRNSLLSYAKQKKIISTVCIAYISFAALLSVKDEVESAMVKEQTHWV